MKHIITSLQHPLVKHLVKLREQRDYRYEQQAMIIEGRKPIQEVASYIKKVVRTEAAEPLPFPVQEEWIVTDAIMKKISGMTSPEGVLVEARMPEPASLKNCRLILALDAINDPGNMGALLRTALALGWEGIYLLPDCCDPFNEKVMRAARGAHFRLPLRQGTAEELQQLAQTLQVDVYAADLEGIAPDQISSRQGMILVLGNEARGLSPEIQRFCQRVTIPMPGQMESLNVAIAGGILMYLFKQ